MESAVDAMVMGPVMIGFTVLWFSVLFWSGMREDDTRRRPTRPMASDEPGPWWAHDGFRAPAPAPVEVENRIR